MCRLPSSRLERIAKLNNILGDDGDTTDADGGGGGGGAAAHTTDDADHADDALGDEVGDRAKAPSPGTRP